MGKIKLRHGDSEIELEGDEGFIERQLEAFYSRFTTHSSIASPALHKGDRQEQPRLLVEVDPRATPTPAEFYRASNHGVTDGVTQIIIFGHYLESFQQAQEFTRADINALVAEARLSKDIHSQYFTNAVAAGFLRQHGKGSYSLTMTAQDYLSNLANGHVPKIETRSKKRKRSVSRESSVDESENGLNGAAKVSKPKRMSHASPKGLLLQLIEEGFFDTGKTLTDINKHTEEVLAGKPMSSTTPLVRLVRDKKLARYKNVEGQYEYKKP